MCMHAARPMKQHASRRMQRAGRTLHAARPMPHAARRMQQAAHRMHAACRQVVGFQNLGHPGFGPFKLPCWAHCTAARCSRVVCMHQAQKPAKCCRWSSHPRHISVARLPHAATVHEAAAVTTTHPAVRPSPRRAAVGEPCSRSPPAYLLQSSTKPRCSYRSGHFLMVTSARNAQGRATGQGREQALSDDGNGT